MHWPRGQKVTQLQKPSLRTVASAHGQYPVYLYAAELPVAIAGVHIDTTAYVF